MTSRLRKLRWPLAGALAGALVVAASTAFAGSGVGGVFNLGQVNKVNASSVLAGNAGSKQLLQVNATGGTGAAIRAMSANGIGVNGVSTYGTGQLGRSMSGVGLLGLHTASSGTASGIEGRSVSSNVNSAGVTGRNTGGGPGLQATVLNNSIPPLRVNSSARVPNLNADQLDGLNANEIARVGLSSNTTVLIGPNSWSSAREVSITAPGPGFVLVTGTAVALSKYPSYCYPCTLFARLRETSGNNTSPVTAASISSDIADDWMESALTSTWVFPVAAAGVATYSLDTGASYTPGGDIVADNPTLVALYVPFGSTGGTTLGADIQTSPTPVRSGHQARAG